MVVKRWVFFVFERGVSACTQRFMPLFNIFMRKTYIYAVYKTFCCIVSLCEYYLCTHSMRRYRHIGTQYFSYLRRYFCLFTLFRMFKKHLVYSKTFFPFQIYFVRVLDRIQAIVYVPTLFFVADIDYTKKRLAIDWLPCSPFEIYNDWRYPNKTIIVW